MKLLIFLMKATVCQAHELADGELRQVRVGNTPVVLVRSDGDIHAMGAFCPHSGAPLAQGLMHGERLICPWHMAAFDCKTGEQYEPPGLDGLTQYSVIVDDGNVIVDVPEDSSPHEVPAMATYNPNVDGRTFMILGAGIAGQTAAEVLRREGFQGRIVMITAETEIPYKRTALSKGFLQKDSADAPPELRPEEFFDRHGIEVWCGRPVAKVMPYSHSLEFEDGSVTTYDQLLVATGGQARALNVPGSDLNHIFTLHKAEDALEILDSIQSAKKAVVIGSSFIGMEAAASLTQAGLSVTVVSPERVPFEKILGPKVGSRIQQLHEDHGVEFRLNQKATGFEGGNDVEAVVTDGGESIPADVVIVGIGIDPATDICDGMKLHPADGSIVVDAYLQAVEGVFAAGDVARYPDARSDKEVRIEHWRLAAQHGRITARNMLGQQVPFKGVPFFWTKQFSMNLHYVGHAESWDDIIIHGDLSGLEFMAFYVEANQIMAVAACGYTQELIAIEELMRLFQLPPADVLQQGPVDWLNLLKQPVAV
jgi:NADPH-dependent 2,4-dienoyl-CoA reductase/sulfur reductase-like enzyme/nitrite reductase/ring-hydroxylating ferredoxin subunit